MSEASSAGTGQRPGRVLVVDDQDLNRTLLRDMLELDGHEVLEAENGIEALAIAAAEDPDVILLDVTMPGLDGFEVCRRLRAAPRTSATPVLLVTGLAEREHRLQGVSSGANDYLVKPIDRGEVAIRVRNALRMRALHRAVDRQYRELQELERLREDLVAMVAHDLRSPLTGLRGFLEMVQAEKPSPLKLPLNALLDDAVRSVDRMNGMIGDMLDVSRMESKLLPLTLRDASLRDLAQRAVAVIGPLPDFHPVRIAVLGDPGELRCDVSLMQRVLVNLIANAVRFSPATGAVTISVRTDEDRVAVRVHDDGPGIAAGEQVRIFEKYAQGTESRSAAGRSSGLGLTFCRMVVDLHGGAIGVDSAVGAGSDFWVALPRTHPTS